MGDAAADLPGWEGICFPVDNDGQMDDVPERVAGATTTLLCGPSLGTATRDCCRDHLARGAADGREVAWVTYTRPPPVCVESLGADVPVRGVLAVGDGTHRETSETAATVEVVATPEDVTALGIKLSRLLSATDGDLAVCFDAVTAMLQYVDAETAYTFVHAIATQLYAAGARAHFHLDPAAHDRSTVDLFASLCDAVVDVGGDESTVRTRPAIE